MQKTLLALSLASSAVFCSSWAGATIRSFVYTQESRVLTPGESELEPWTTFRAGQSRYYSALDGRLELEHGVTKGLQLALYWNFKSETQDVVADSLTQKLERVSRSELTSASLELKYQLSDPTADLLGSALYFEATLGPRESELEAKLIVDRSLGHWLLAANASSELELEPTRGAEGSELETAFLLEPSLAAAYVLAHGTSLGVELRAPLQLTGDAKSSTLFGGPVLRWADQNLWAALGVQPQLLAFSDQSPNSRLDLTHRQRLEVRLLAGFML
jgi:hypothetical protein